jgi:hypothetical protein
MAEVLLKFATPTLDDDGRAYTPQICGRQGEEGRWEGWIEFAPADGGAPLRTGVETTQPKWSDLEYWASGLTAAYLEGALERALHPAPTDLRPRQVEASPAYDGPAPSASAAATAAAARTAPPHGVLNPFQVYGQGEGVLRGQLSALDADKLRSIVREHELVGADELDLQELSQPALVDLIVAAVRKRTE